MKLQGYPPVLRSALIENFRTHHGLFVEANNVAGEIRVYGTPAEEGGSGKVYMVREGLFDDVDATLHWHPSDGNSAAQSVSLANISGKFRFAGASAHAGNAAPGPD